MKTNYLRRFIFALSSLCVVLSFYLDIFPKYKRLIELEKEEQALQIRYEEEKKLIYQKNNIYAQTEFLRQVLAPYLKSEGDTGLNVEFNTSILKVLQESGLSFESMKPGTLSQAEFFTNIEMSLRAHGTFDQLMDFLRKLQEKIPVAKVKTLQLHSEANDQLVILLNLVGSYIHVNREDVRNLNTFKTALFVPHLRDPFNSTPRSVSLQQIKFVGYLLDLHQHWVLALLPNHQTIAVKEGDSLGLEGAVLVSVHENNVLLKLDNHYQKRNYALGIGL